MLVSTFRGLYCWEGRRFFATATILYSSLWMYIVRHPAAPVELGS